MGSGVPWMQSGISLIMQKGSLCCMFILCRFLVIHALIWQYTSVVAISEDAWYWDHKTLLKHIARKKYPMYKLLLKSQQVSSANLVHRPVCCADWPASCLGLSVRAVLHAYWRHTTALEEFPGPTSIPASTVPNCSRLTKKKRKKQQGGI